MKNLFHVLSDSKKFEQIVQQYQADGGPVRFDNQLSILIVDSYDSQDEVDAEANKLKERYVAEYGTDAPRLIPMHWSEVT